jgi:hypothetical protein
VLHEYPLWHASRAPKALHDSTHCGTVYSPNQTNAERVHTQRRADRLAENGCALSNLTQLQQELKLTVYSLDAALAEKAQLERRVAEQAERIDVRPIRPSPSAIT